MIAQTVHIPVHPGSMPLSVKADIEHFKGNRQPGEVVVLNDPFRGGDGIIRKIQVLTDFQVTLLSDRHEHPLHGLAGGTAGQTGENLLIHTCQETHLPEKGSVDLHAGDVLSIRAPGGGGHAKKG
jgi:N-methylhydantoinase B/oxoprolinase/acetone carboxylase alpha subunit